MLKYYMHKIKENFSWITNEQIKHTIRKTIINTWWKILHSLIWWWKSLEETAKQYIKKLWIEIKIDDDSKNNLNEFKNSDKWLIISNHESWVFSDYLPIFAELWDEILKKSIFYTWAYNLEMNKKEFPDYNFRAATLTKREDVRELKENIKNDIAKIKEEWWYIFLIPSWENTEYWWEFKGIFQKMIKSLDHDFPILASKIEHQNWKWSYSEIWKYILKNFSNKIANIIWESDKLDTLSFKLVKSWLFKWENWDTMKRLYLELFKNKWFLLKNIPHSAKTDEEKETNK